MEPAIKVESLSKAYRLGEIGTGSLSNDLHRWWTKKLGKEDPYLTIGEENDRSKKGYSNIVWSLKDVNFEIGQGEAVGIIGRNGAGKSTLLKILSRVTLPTTGAVSGIGRVASLLEVGTGFHPELTGRENIYLNGAILGMRKKEISRQFDAIVDFSGVERYIDTPVKRYSSGMYIRLAFAVAAHLESEILIVDEVLAVGDAEFQKKCLGKMGEVSKGQGRTILFVSHNMGSINALCDRTLILNNGKINFDGGTEAGINYYLEMVNKTSGSELFIDDGNLRNFISFISPVDEFGKLRSEFGSSGAVYLQLKIKIADYHPALELGLALMDRRNNRVFTIHEILFGNLMSVEESEKTVTVQIPHGFLAPGSYSWIAIIHIPHQQQFHLLENISNFRIVDTGTKFSDYDGQDMGIVMPKYTFI